MLHQAAHYCWDGHWSATLGGDGVEANGDGRHRLWLSDASTGAEAVGTVERPREDDGAKRERGRARITGHSPTPNPTDTPGREVARAGSPGDACLREIDLAVGEICDPTRTSSMSC